MSHFKTTPKKGRKIAAFIAAATVFVTGSVLFLWHKYRADISGRKIVCVMEKLPGNDTVSGLVFGYNYHIIKKLAEKAGAEAEIFLARKDTKATDWLKTEEADMAVIPDNLLSADSIRFTISYDCASFWIFPIEDRKLAKAFSKQMEAYRKSEEYDTDRQLFLRKFNPIADAANGIKVSYLSPYDHLFKAAADSSGFDWRFLAAIAFQESHFHIEVNSRRGAYGLMQLMPATAARMNTNNPLDPEESINSAANYLQLLYKRYRKAANEEERLKFTLAGYNAGEGRIKQFTSMADTMNVDRTYWKNVSDLFDKTEFKGSETRYYVDKVMDIYKAMCKIIEP